MSDENTATFILFLFIMIIVLLMAWMVVQHNEYRKICIANNYTKMENYKIKNYVNCYNLIIDEGNVVKDYHMVKLK